MRREAFHDYGKAVVHARIEGASLVLEITSALSSGTFVAYRGHRWYPRHFSVLHASILSVEASFSLWKAVQYPEMWASRVKDARNLLGDALLQIEGGATAPVAQVGDAGQRYPLLPVLALDVTPEASS